MYIQKGQSLQICKKLTKLVWLKYPKLYHLGSKITRKDTGQANFLMKPSLKISQSYSPG